MQEPSLTRTIGRFVAETPSSAIPEAVRDRARISLAHNLLVALASGGRAAAAEAYVRRFHAGTPEASILGSNDRVDLEAAAFVNGSLFHARSQDDTHAASTSHPGAPVMGAALAVAEAEGASGRAFLDAVIMGYEALCRIGRDTDQEVTRRGFRAAAIFGGFGSAAASARLMTLSAEETRHALSFAAHEAGGLAQVWLEGSAEYPMQLGLAARHGVVAARLAAVGMTAAELALEGRAGLFAAVAGAKEPFPEALAGLGVDWQIAEATVKAFPACAILQGPLGLMRDILSSAGADADVERIDLALNPYEAGYPGIDNPGPRFASPTAAKMSAQFCLGIMALDHRLWLADLDRLNDYAVRDMAGRIAVHADPDIPERLCALKIEFTDGRVLHGRVDHPAGRPDFEELSSFAHSLGSEASLENDKVDRLLDVVSEIDLADDVRPLLDACRM